MVEMGFEYSIQQKEWSLRGNKGYDIFQNKCTYYESLFPSLEHHLGILEKQAGLVTKAQADDLLEINTFFNEVRTFSFSVTPKVFHLFMQSLNHLAEVFLTAALNRVSSLLGMSPQSFGFNG